MLVNLLTIWISGAKLHRFWSNFIQFKWFGEVLRQKYKNKANILSNDESTADSVCTMNQYELSSELIKFDHSSFVAYCMQFISVLNEKLNDSTENVCVDVKHLSIYGPLDLQIDWRKFRLMPNLPNWMDNSKFCILCMVELKRSLCQ